MKSMHVVLMFLLFNNLNASRSNEIGETNIKYKTIFKSLFYNKEIGVEQVNIQNMKVISIVMDG